MFTSQVASQEYLQTIKIYWSWTWRMMVYFFILSIFVIPLFAGIHAVCPSLFREKIDIILLYVLGAIFFYSYLIVTQESFQKIREINYRGFKVSIIRDGTPLSKISTMDAFCLICSFSWRAYLMFFICVGFVFVLPLFFSGLSIEESFWVVMRDRDISFLSSVLGPIGLLWLIKRKKTGICIRIEDTSTIQENKNERI